MRNGSVVYLCRRISPPSSDTQEFDKPQKFVLRPRYLTIQPFTGNIFDNTFGEFRDYTEKGCAVPYEFWENKISEGDRFYINTIPQGYETGEQPEQGWGYDADYVVNSVSKQNIAIYFAMKSILEN